MKRTTIPLTLIAILLSIAFSSCTPKVEDLQKAIQSYYSVVDDSSHDDHYHLTEVRIINVKKVTSDTVSVYARLTGKMTGDNQPEQTLHSASRFTIVKSHGKLVVLSERKEE